MREVVLFADGGCNGLSSRKNPVPIGAGIVALCEDFREEWAISLGVGTSQQAEILAVKTGLQLMTNPRELNVLVVTDSQYVQGVFGGAEWHLKHNGSMIYATRKVIRRFCSFRIQWTKGHAATEENVRADQLAAVACGRKTCPNTRLYQLEELGLATTGNCQSVPRPIFT